MPEYIDREAVIRAVVNAVDNGLATTSDDLAEVIGDLPAADVEPVRHGQWKGGYCTHCGSPCLCNGIEEDVLSPYCPNCGAKMDLEEVAK